MIVLLEWVVNIAWFDVAVPNRHYYNAYTVWFRKHEGLFFEGFVKGYGAEEERVVLGLSDRPRDCLFANPVFEQIGYQYLIGFVWVVAP